MRRCIERIVARVGRVKRWETLQAFRVNEVRRVVDDVGIAIVLLGVLDAAAGGVRRQPAALWVEEYMRKKVGLRRLSELRRPGYQL